MSEEGFQVGDIIYLAHNNSNEKINEDTFNKYVGRRARITEGFRNIGYSNAAVTVRFLFDGHQMNLMRQEIERTPPEKSWEI